MKLMSFADDNLNLKCLFKRFSKISKTRSPKKIYMELGSLIVLVLDQAGSLRESAHLIRLATVHSTNAVDAVKPPERTGECMQPRSCFHTAFYLVCKKAFFLVWMTTNVL